MRGVRGSADEDWGRCMRCGCSVFRHTSGGCKNLACDCPQAVKVCCECNEFFGAGSARKWCRNCYYDKSLAVSWPGCARCGCSATRHGPLGCKNKDCTCPKPIVPCPSCGGEKSAYTNGICRNCYREESQRRQEAWLALEPERQAARDPREQKKKLREGAATLREVKKLLRHGA